MKCTITSREVGIGANIYMMHDGSRLCKERHVVNFSLSCVLHKHRSSSIENSIGFVCLFVGFG